MANTMDITNQILEVLTKKSDQIGTSYFVKWRIEALSLLQQAQLYQRKYDKLSSIKISSIEGLQSILREEMRQDEATNNLITKMYRFLNEVGETLRGETIHYEVTLTQGKGKERTIQTFTLNLEQFLSITAKTSTRLTLRHTSSALKELQNQQILGRQWSQEEIKELDKYRTNVKRNKGGHWKNINKGNVLEGFRRKQIKGMSTTMSIAETMSGTQGFWQGGDIDLLQIKGDRASVTNFKTCVNQIEKLFNTLSALNTETATPLSEKTQQLTPAIDVNIDEFSSETVGQIVSGLQKQFFVNI